MATDTDSLWDNARNVVGQDYGRRAAQAACKAGVGPDDIDVVELHDCFTERGYCLRSLGFVR